MVLPGKKQLVRNSFEKKDNYLAEGGMTQEFSEQQRYDKYITDSGFNKELVA